MVLLFLKSNYSDLCCYGGMFYNLYYCFNGLWCCLFFGLIGKVNGVGFMVNWVGLCVNNCLVLLLVLKDSDIVILLIDIGLFIVIVILLVSCVVL